MTGLDCHEGATTSGGDFAVRDQFSFDDRPIGGRLDYSRYQVKRFIGWRRPQEFNRVVGGYGARRTIEPVLLHEVVGGGPIAMTIEDGSGDAAAQHPRKCFLVGLRLPVSYYLFAGGKTANMQSFFVCRATAETLQIWSVSFLDAFLVHGDCPTDLLLLLNRAELV